MDGPEAIIEQSEKRIKDLADLIGSGSHFNTSLNMFGGGFTGGFDPVRDIDSENGSDNGVENRPQNIDLPLQSN